MQTILRTIFISLTLSLAQLAHSFAGPYEDGIEAAKRGDHETALQIFRSLAEKGNPKGQTGVGRMYHQGWGVPQDYAEAAKWYRKAAEQGYPGAQNNLGVMYGKGQGVPQDIVKATEWYRRAAEQGYAIAQDNLGDRYRLGDSVPKGTSSPFRANWLA